MDRKRTTRHSCNHAAPKASTLVKGRQDYNTYTFRAAVAMLAMYLFMAFGAVVFGW